MDHQPWPIVFLYSSLFAVAVVVFVFLFFFLLCM